MVDYAKMLQNLQQYEEDRKKRQEEGGSYEYLPVSFLQAGKHEVKIIADPEDNIFHVFGYHNTPNGYYALTPNDPIEKWIEEDNDSRWQGHRWSTKCIVHLIKTDAPSDYWVAGNTYLLVGPPKLANALSSYVAMVLSQDTKLGAMFDASIESSGVILIDHSKSNTNVSLVPYGRSPKVELGKWYRPLNRLWIDETYVPSEEEWANAVKSLELGEQYPPESPTDGEEKKGEPTPSNLPAPEGSNVPNTQPVTPPVTPNDAPIRGQKMVEGCGGFGEGFAVTNNACLSNKCGVNSNCVKARGGV